MNKIIFLLTCICMFTSCGQAPNRSDDYQQQINDNQTTIYNLSKEQSGLINSNTSDYSKLLLNIKKTARIVGDQNKQCLLAIQTPSYFECMSIFRSLNIESAKIELITAEYLAKNGKKELAKEIYHDIITTYIGNTYAPYVKQAKLSLKGLNEK
jgi:hypothetical protein